MSEPLVADFATPREAPRLDREASQHEILARLSRLLPAQSYLEVGVRDGCSLWVVLEANSRIKRLALADDWGTSHGGTGRGSHEHVAALLRDIGWPGRVTWLDGRSQETLPELGMRVPTPKFDLVHVDGDHSYRGALADLRNCWPLTLRAMVVHDVDLVADVRRAVEKFSLESRREWSHHTGGHGTAVFWRDAS